MISDIGLELGLHRAMWLVILVHLMFDVLVEAVLSRRDSMAHRFGPQTCLLRKCFKMPGATACGADHHDVHF